MNSKVLRLNKAGTPIAWLSWQETATLPEHNCVWWQGRQPSVHPLT